MEHVLVGSIILFNVLLTFLKRLLYLLYNFVIILNIYAYLNLELKFFKNKVLIRRYYNENVKFKILLHS